MTSDSGVRQLALDPAQSFIVQAPAGSGKTALLVYRILQALTTVDKPEQVLALTFTRKATAEMRERLLGLLRAAEAMDQSDNAFEQQGIDLATQVLRKDREFDWQLLDAPEQLQIHTIDGFCARLSGDMPWLSRLGDKPGTTDDASHLYGAAVEALLSSLLETQQDDTHEALQSVLLELDFDYRKLRKLLLQMLAKRDQWLRHLVQNDLASLRDKLNSSWRALLDETLLELETSIPQTLLTSLIKQANNAAPLIPQDKPQMEAFKQTPISKPSELTPRHWRNLQQMVTLANASKFRSRVDVTIGFPKEDKERKAKMSALLDTLKDNPALLSPLQTLSVLPEPTYTDHDWQQLLALEKVLLRLAALLQLEFRNSGECDHSEVAQRALRALADLDAPTDLGLRIDYQIKHILVDEFQDTSRSQLELLRQLTAGWQAEDGRSLFLVGDPMQSIYRFREADVSLFLQVADNANTGVFDNLQIQALQLSENFRSTADLVHWFNQTYSSSFPSRGDVLSGAIRYASSTSNKEHRGSVQAELVHTARQEAERVVDHIKRRLADDDVGKVAVLVRSRSHLADIISTLEDAQIAYTGVDIKPLAEVAAIQDIVTLCKAICRPQDRLIWFSLMRSPLLGLRLVELCEFGDGDVIAELKNLPLQGDRQARVKHFTEVMEQALTQRQQSSLSAITNWAWNALGGLQLGADVSDGDLQRVFEVISRLEIGGDLPSLDELDTALDRFHAQPNALAGDRVILSTIHRAKGLQYSTVILPGLDRKSGSDDKDVLMWAERNDEHGKAQLLIAPINLYPEGGQHYEYLRHLEKERSRQEMVRLMYVACTRAEQEIVLLAQHEYNTDGNMRKPIASSLLSTVWESLESQFKEIPDIDTKVVTSQKIDQTLMRLPASFRPEFDAAFDWQNQGAINAQSAEHDDLDYQWATELATGVGIVLHNWLELNSEQLFTFKIGAHHKRQWHAELSALRVPEERLNTGVKRLETAIKNMQSDVHASFIFGAHAEAQNELALSCLRDGQLARFKIDRTFVDEHNTRWIVDYKTTTTQQSDITTFIDTQISERHRPQLENYGQLMQKLDPRPIMLAVYFPLLREFRSWPYQHQP